LPEALDRKGDRALYLQIADQLREQVVTGKLAPGSRLPSEHSLMAAYDASRDTVRKAIGVLKAEDMAEFVRDATDEDRHVLAQRHVAIFAVVESRLLLREVRQFLDRPICRETQTALLSRQTVVRRPMPERARFFVIGGEVTENRDGDFGVAAAPPVHPAVVGDAGRGRVGPGVFVAEWRRIEASVQNPARAGVRAAQERGDGDGGTGGVEQDRGRQVVVVQPGRQVVDDRLVRVDAAAAGYADEASGQVQDGLMIVGGVLDR